MTLTRVERMLPGMGEPAVNPIEPPPLTPGESDFKTIVFAEGRGFLRFHIFEEQRVVVLAHLTWR
jgi:hypothetical protein